MKAKYLLIIILIVSFCFTGNGEVVLTNHEGFNPPAGLDGLNTFNSENIINTFSGHPKKKKSKPKKKKKKKTTHKKKKKTSSHKKKKKKKRKPRGKGKSKAKHGIR